MATADRAPVVLRMDDVGAASKRNEVHGAIRIPALFGVTAPRIYRRFPTNFWFVKRLPGIRQWGPYRELSAAEWDAILTLLERHRAKLTVAITAGWVEDDGRVTPFPKKYPEQAQLLRRGVETGLVEIANHGYTHCLLDGFREQVLRGNRREHREFDELPTQRHADHLRRAQDILQSWFGVRVETFVPPGTGFTRTTLEAAADLGLRYVSGRNVSRLARERGFTGDGLVFVDSFPALDPSTAAGHRGELVWHFHDRDLVLKGLDFLGSLVEANRDREILTLRDAGVRRTAASPAR